jgi:hypothetical protein
MKRLTLFLASLIICSFTCVHAQEEPTNKKIEVDLAVMPVTKAIINQADVISADIAIRYKLSDNFSAGVCASPTFIDYGYGYGETNYVPFFLSFRYNFMDNKTITPYLLLNLGGSFLQLEPDDEFQGKFSIGANLNISKRCSLFFETGIAYITTRDLWSPTSIGIRL